MKMQQTKSYWRLVAVAGVVSAFVASACVVTTDDPGDSKGGSGGSGATAGSSTSGGSSSTVGSSAAGSSAHAGSGTAGSGTDDSVTCDDQTSAGGAPGEGSSCEPADATDECQVCIQKNCCEEYGACYATNPNNQCGYGGPLVNNKYQEGGELFCMHECLKDAVAKSMISATEEDIRTCAGKCTTDMCDTSSVGFQTSDIIGCMNSNCTMECWGPK